ncbi:MAG TPA: ABC transporter ATP-binding protein [Candidatus Binatia bacterium]|nr:ABC transporter ATP-binding protein [Candidatus Binatia bacterium]
MNAIEVRGVSKTYRIPHERHTTLAERVLSWFRPSGFELFPALNDVSLDVPEGTFVGVIGANGSGKSTLLKLMAGLLVPDAGAVLVSGTVAPLLELGLGFHNELTVAENISLYGAVLGYPPGRMAERVDEVVAFAELERFRDAKLKSLSSGMLMRLAFATALRADADILLLDEVLAVGDARFQQKCFDVFADLKKRRRTIVLVSHDVASVQRFCDRVFWIDAGRLAMAGAADEVVKTYLAISRADMLRRAAEKEPLSKEDIAGLEPVHRFGDGDIRFVEGTLERTDGTTLARVRAGERVVLRLRAVVNAVSAQPTFGMIVKQLGALGGHPVYSTNTKFLDLELGPFAPGDEVEVRIPFTASLVDGHYTVHVAAADGHAGVVHDWINDYVTFSVEESSCHEGILDLRAEFHCEVVRRDRLALTGTESPPGGTKP